MKRKMNYKLNRILNYEKDVLEKYSDLTNLPKDYDPNDPENIQKFAERLKYVLDTVDERNSKIRYDAEGHLLEGGNYCTVTNNKQLAAALGVSTPLISQYVHGNVRKVPLHHLMQLAAIFGITPHYLLGLVERTNGVLHMDKEGNVICDKDGKPVELIYPIVLRTKDDYVANRILFQVYIEAPRQFMTLVRLLSAEDHIRDSGFQMLEVYLKSHKEK